MLFSLMQCKHVVHGVLHSVWLETGYVELERLSDLPCGLQYLVLPWSAMTLAHSPPMSHCLDWSQLGLYIQSLGKTRPWIMNGIAGSSCRLWEFCCLHSHMLFLLQHFLYSSWLFFSLDVLTQLSFLGRFTAIWCNSTPGGLFWRCRQLYWSQNFWVTPELISTKVPPLVGGDSRAIYP